MPGAEIDVVLFDLGGVLFDFGGVEPMKSLSGIADDEDLWRRWLACRWVRSFERGGCTPEDFAVGVVTDWRLAITPNEFLDAFRSWVKGPLDGADALVRDAQRNVKVGCLSNTNPVHWEYNHNRWAILDAFDVRLLSFEMGCVKPDRETFDRAAQRLDCLPSRVLFLDDNAINVEGATAAGFRAARTVGVRAARHELASIGIVDHE